LAIYKKATELAGLPIVPYEPVIGLLPPTMLRLELRSTKPPGKSWAIALAGKQVILQAGRKQTLTFASAQAARERFRRLVDEKVQEGWLPPYTRELLRARPRKRRWAITVVGRERTIIEGSAGAEGKVTTRVFKTRVDAMADAERRIAAKLAEGYVEQLPAPSSLREALFAAVRANPEDTASRGALMDWLVEQGEEPPAIAWRVDAGLYDSGFSRFRAFLDEPAVGFVEALVVGACWNEAATAAHRTSAPFVEALVAARQRLPRLRALFLGDMTYRDNEISWIRQSDITPLFAAFPRMEHFRLRGGDGLVLRKFRHERLKSLVIEASNLPRAVTRALGASELPALEHLEVWLGTSRYGANTKPADLAGILQGDGLPALRHLGLRNSEIVDAIAARLGRAAILSRLRSLDLSLGTLTDRGAKALLAIPELGKLERLDFHYNYLSPEMAGRVAALGPAVEAGDRREEDYWGGEAHRYVAHSE